MPESQIKVQLNPDVTPAGSDLSIVNAARRSFNTRSEWANAEDLWIEPYVPLGIGFGDEVRFEMINPYIKPVLKDKDKRLLEFLARGMTADDFDNFLVDISIADMDWSWYKESPESLKKLLWQWRNTPTHDTPFNHTFISFEVQAPIFVRAQLVKHEYLIMSEFSRRYITDDVTFYEPDVWRKAAENKKQGSSSESIHSWHVEDSVMALGENALSVYKDLLKEGVAPEQARMLLPQSTMTEWTWSGTLGAFAKMCTLRLHPEAQYEAVGSRASLWVSQRVLPCRG